MAENGERPTVEGAIRGALMKLIARDAKKRGGEMARYGFLPSLLWQMLRAEMNADGMAVVPPTGTPDGFPAIMLGGVPLYADDCDDHVRFMARSGLVRYYAWVSIYAAAITPSTVGRAPETAPGQSPQGAAGQAGG